VLVAAIAAGVLINTAGFLQSQAEATGQESTDQVSNSLQSTVTTGTTKISTGGNGNAGVQSIEVGLQLAPGSDAISVSGLSIQVFADGQTATSISSDLGTAGSGDASITDGAGTGVSVIDDSQTYYLVFESDTIFGTIDSSTSPTVDGLLAGNEVSIEITTADGSQTEIVATAPDPITNDSDEIILD
jgi:flagellin FlaB